MALRSNMPLCIDTATPYLMGWRRPAACWLPSCQAFAELELKSAKRYPPADGAQSWLCLHQMDDFGQAETGKAEGGKSDGVMSAWASEITSR